MHAAYKAMIFARERHKDQRRKYTGELYITHLAEVAGIVASVSLGPTAIAAAWLHDCVEDQNVTQKELRDAFGIRISQGVMILSDRETGNRAERKAASRQRLAAAPAWVQSIKCADLISNTGSILLHDPTFAKQYLYEKRLLLAVLGKANRRLWTLASELAERA